MAVARINEHATWSEEPVWSLGGDMLIVAFLLVESIAPIVEPDEI